MSKVSQQFPRQFSDTGKEICTLCCEEASAWAVGSCDHAVCLTCSARLRILCGKKECPICREVNEKVAVFQKPQAFVIPSSPFRDRKHGFIFSKTSLVNFYEKLRALRCMECNAGGFYNMRNLQEHARKDHGLFFCEICFEHLKLFPFEHKTYSRTDLVRHRRSGDPDNKSHKGHPQCAFCDERYFGKDELYFHLKKNHFWCHFCEQEGIQDEYYPDYKALKDHFQLSHYLCEEGPCRHEKFINAFLSKLDLQAHKAKVHTRGLSKSEAKQLRQVDVGFTYTRPERGVEGMGGVNRRQYRQAGYMTADQRDLDAAIDLSIAEQGRESTRNEPSEDYPLPEVRDGGGRGTKETIKTTKPKDPPIIAKQDIKKPPGLDHAKADVKKPPGLDHAKADVKKPPGLEHVKPDVATALTARQITTINKTDVDEDEQRDEWPSLGLESLKTPTTDKYICLGRFQRAEINTDPPPGLRRVGSSENYSTAFSEFSILEDAMILLQHNPDKINHFKLLSGQYQKGLITVEVYNDKCRKLFGQQSWREFGIRLARTLPNAVKQNELYTILITSSDQSVFNAPPGFFHPIAQYTPNPTSTSNMSHDFNPKETKKSKKRKNYRNASYNAGSDITNKSKAGAWKQQSATGKANLKESDYPSLDSAARMPNPVVPHVPSWNVKVAV